MQKHRKKIVSIIAVLLAVLMLLSLFISVLPTAAYAVNESDLAAIRQQKEQVASQRMACQEKIEKLKEQHALVLEQKAALDERNEYTAEQIDLVEEEIVLYDKMIEEKSRQVDAAREKEERQLQRYRSRVRALEENGNYDILGIILQSANLSDVLTALDDMGEIMARDRKLEDEYIAAREAREAEQAEYEELRADCEEKKLQLEEEKKELEAQLQEAYDLLAELEEDIEKAKKEYEAALAAEEAFAAQMSAIAAQIAREAAERAQQAAQQAQQQQQQQQAGQNNQGSTGGGDTGSSGNTGGGGDSGNGGDTGSSGDTGSTGGDTGGGGDSSPAPAPAPEPPANSESWGWPFPASNLVTSRYGYRIHPILGTQRFHAGIDVNGLGLEGSPIVAAKSGTVCKAEYSDSYGNYVMIDHGNGDVTLYAHFSGIAVYNGQEVTQGQTVGYCGHTGWATGDHLHFEMYINGSRVDPESIFGGLPHYDC